MKISENNDHENKTQQHRDNEFRFEAFDVAVSDVIRGASIADKRAGEITTANKGRATAVIHSAFVNVHTDTTSGVLALHIIVTIIVFKVLNALLLRQRVTPPRWTFATGTVLVRTLLVKASQVADVAKLARPAAEAGA